MIHFFHDEALEILLNFERYLLNGLEFLLCFGIDIVHNLWWSNWELVTLSSHSFQKNTDMTKLLKVITDLHVP